jgi:mRNA-degrading endonuclease RelE of RelBE toxin-antitoxin system
LAYNVSLTSRARRQLTDILEGAAPSRRRNVSRAFDVLEKNPYPTNPDVGAAAIKRLQGTRKWRLKVDHEYRMIYRINDHDVIVERIAHRREVYRGL